LKENSRELKNMREIVLIQMGDCGNKIGEKVRKSSLGSLDLNLSLMS
jgi:hypothetical protein